MNFPLSNQGHRDLLAYLAAVFVVLLMLVRPVSAPALNVSSALLQVAAGNTVSVRVTGASGKVNAMSSDRDIATVNYDHGVATIRGLAAGTATITLWDRENSRRVAVAVVPAAGGEAAASASRAPMI